MPTSNALQRVSRDPLPASPGGNIRAFNHLLGECGVTFLGSKKLASIRKSFPRSLDGAPFLLPLDNTALRRDLDGWFHANNLRPTVVGEFADLALLRVFAEKDLGAFAVPTVMEEQMHRYGFYKLGMTQDITVLFFAISVERQLRHPAVVAVCDAARKNLFRIPKQSRTAANR